MKVLHLLVFLMDVPHPFAFITPLMTGNPEPSALNVLGKLAGTCPNVAWRMISEQDLRLHPLYVAL